MHRLILTLLALSVMGCDSDDAFNIFSNIDTLKKQANSGYPEAKFNLVGRYTTGEVADKDTSKAIEWYKRKRNKVMQRQKKHSQN